MTCHDRRPLPTDPLGNITTNARWTCIHGNKPGEERCDQPCLLDSQCLCGGYGGGVGLLVVKNNTNIIAVKYVLKSLLPQHPLPPPPKWLPWIFSGQYIRHSTAIPHHHHSRYYFYPCTGPHHQSCYHGSLEASITVLPPPYPIITIVGTTSIPAPAPTTTIMYATYL